MNLLLDTCAVLWLASAPEKLSDETQRRVSTSTNQIFVSAISAGELACLAARQRVSLPTHWKPWFHQAVRTNGWSVLPIELETVEEAYSLPEDFHPDPADRIIVATARLHRLTVVTGDRRILDYPHVESIA